MAIILISFRTEGREAVRCHITRGNPAAMAGMAGWSLPPRDFIVLVFQEVGSPRVGRRCRHGRVRAAI